MHATRTAQFSNWIRKKKQYQSILVGISLTQPHAGLFFSEFIWAAKAKCRMMPNWAHYLTDDCWPRDNSCVSLFLKFKKVISSQIKKEKQEKYEDFSWSQRYLIYITIVVLAKQNCFARKKQYVCINYLSKFSPRLVSTDAPKISVTSNV